jgi:hypothetical protein
MGKGEEKRERGRGVGLFDPTVSSLEEAELF